MLFEPQCQKAYLRTCAPCDDSDQPAYARRLIWIVTRRDLDSHWCKVSSCGQRRLRSNYTDPCLCWMHVRRYFFHVTSHILFLASHDEAQLLLSRYYDVNASFSWEFLKHLQGQTNCVPTLCHWTKLSYPFGQTFQGGQCMPRLYVAERCMWSGSSLFFIQPPV